MYSNGTIGVLHYYNNGKYPSLLSTNDPKIGFSNIVTSYIENTLKCSFTRVKSLSGVSNHFDLNSQYYFLTASGSLSNTESITRHTSRKSSSDKFNLLFDDEYSTLNEEKDSSKVKVHSCLMIFAWLFCASTGILIARYFKI